MEASHKAQYVQPWEIGAKLVRFNAAVYVFRRLMGRPKCLWYKFDYSMRFGGEGAVGSLFAQDDSSADRTIFR